MYTICCKSSNSLLNVVLGVEWALLDVICIDFDLLNDEFFFVNEFSEISGDLVIISILDLFSSGLNESFLAFIQCLKIDIT